MSLFAIIFSLLLEQIRPLGARHPMRTQVYHWYAYCARLGDAGGRGQAWLWLGLAIALPTLVVVTLHRWFLAQGGIFGWMFSFFLQCLILYGTLGFRQFSTHFSAIRLALDADDWAQARAHLLRWMGQPTGTIDGRREEFYPRVIAQSIIASHRHVLGVLSAYALFAFLGLGAAGAVLYRLCDWLQQWIESNASGPSSLSPQSRELALQYWAWVDFLPVRVSVVLFAVVGNFEETISAWRDWGSEHRAPLARGGTDLRANDALLLSCASGALGVQIIAQNEVPAVLPSSEDESVDGRVPAQAKHLPLMVGLLWRAVVLFLLLQAMLLVAKMTA